MTNEFFRYFDIRIAESITVTGQLTIKWVEKTVNDYLNKVLETNSDYIIAIDTDSLYIDFGLLVQKVFPNGVDIQQGINFLDQVCSKTLNQTLKKSFSKLGKYLNTSTPKIEMKREAIANKAIWTGKKHYALNVYDSEGVRYEKPKLKIKGLEAIKSSTPAPCRIMYKTILDAVINHGEEEAQQLIRNYREQFNKLTPEEIAFPRSASDLNKFRNPNTLYSKSTPIHVRAALLYNFLLKKYSLETKYETIYNGEKIKFCYLRTPNKINENIIAFLTILPDEFELRKYIDYDTQFDKALIEPIRKIFDAIGWRVEPMATLEKFYE